MCAYCGTLESVMHIQGDCWSSSLRPTLHVRHTSQFAVLQGLQSQAVASAQCYRVLMPSANTTDKNMIRRADSAALACWISANSSRGAFPAFKASAHSKAVPGNRLLTAAGAKTRLLQHWNTTEMKQHGSALCTPVGLSAQAHAHR